MKTATINNKSLSYLDIGEGYPVLFGHSYLWNAAMWEPQIHVLSKHYRCIVPELWAHGCAGNPDTSPYSLETLAEDYWQLMQSLNLNQFAVVGLSVGDMWATQMALNHKEAISALVVMDSFVGTEPTLPQQYYFSLMDAMEQAGSIPQPIKEAVTPFFFAPETLENNKELVSYFHKILDSYSPEQIKGILSIGRGIFARKSYMERLNEITAPTLIMTGEFDKPRPPQEGKLMADAIPGAKLEIIPGAGHISNLEEPKFVTEKLKEFLGDVLGKKAAA